MECLEDRRLPSVDLLSQFLGFSFSETDAIQPLGGITPPDTAGAAGPIKYVETVNQSIRISNKADGSAAVTDNLADFWYTQGGLKPIIDAQGSGLTDAMMVWDDLAQRFIIGDQDVDSGTAHDSVFDLAVSKTASPATTTKADWYFFQVNTTENNATTGVFDADFPGNFGYNADAFVFTLDMFAVSGGTDHVQVNALQISSLINGTLNAFQNDFTGFNLRPVVMHDAKPGGPMRFVTEHGDNTSVDIVQTTNVLSNAAIFTTTNVPVTPYSQTVPPLQPDGTAVTTNIFSDFLKAAEWNGKLAAAHVISTSATEDAIRWYEFNVNGTTPTLVDQGTVFSPATGSGTNNVYDYFPGMDINSEGDIGLTFMQSSNTGPNAGQFMSVYVTLRTPSDPTGTMEMPVLVQAGAQNYHDFAGVNQRAGDMSGINVDADGSFWAVNEFANTDASANWGTVIAHFRKCITIDEVVTYYVTGAGVGGGPEVKVFDSTTKRLVFDFFAYDPNFTGGVRVATGDVNGDGYPDIITVPGPGGGPEVRVFSGKDASLLMDFNAFNARLTTGLFVAAGDTNGDLKADIIVAPDRGAGPNVRVFDGATGKLAQNFNAFNPRFTGGVRVAAGDLNDDGVADIVVGAGAGGGPNVEAFDGRLGTLLQNFMAYDPRFTGGVFVATGRFDALTDIDCPTKDIITGPGAGGGSNVRVFDGGTGQLLRDFMAPPQRFIAGTDGDVAALFGTHVSSIDHNGTRLDDIMVAYGEGANAVVNVFDFNAAKRIDSFFAYNPLFAGGVFIGSGH